MEDSVGEAGGIHAGNLTNPLEWGFSDVPFDGVDLEASPVSSVGDAVAPAGAMDDAEAVAMEALEMLHISIAGGPGLCAIEKYRKDGREVEGSLRSGG